ncbi:hypothetical protein [Nostoc sp.]|uniref:hypothetical protein n=1 Tax=Nostoc sp. TaxID=1180 RepID=UPI002FFC5908
MLNPTNAGMLGFVPQTPLASPVGDALASLLPRSRRLPQEKKKGYKPGNPSNAVAPQPRENRITGVNFTGKSRRLKAGSSGNFTDPFNNDIASVKLA